MAPVWSWLGFLGHGGEACGLVEREGPPRWSEAFRAPWLSPLSLNSHARFNFKGTFPCLWVTCILGGLCVVAASRKGLPCLPAPWPSPRLTPAVRSDTGRRGFPQIAGKLWRVSGLRFLIIKVESES